MNYYEGAVVEYLRSDRAIFLNTQCLIQINPTDNPDTGGPHWYCDAVAADFRSRCVYLCEVSYSARLTDLTNRLVGWNNNWDLVCNALRRDSLLGNDWPVRPWLFVPEHLVPILLRRFDEIAAGQLLKFAPRVTPLEMVQPWLYRSWNRIGEANKAATIPEAMQC